MVHNSLILKALLVIAGSGGCLVGLAGLLIPVQFEASSGIMIGGDISLLNELRASGGGLLGVGLFILAGAFVAELTRASTLLAAIVYLGYGLARLLSIALDGLPDPLLIQVTGLEVLVGLSCLAAFLKTWRQRSNRSASH